MRRPISETLYCDYIKEREGFDLMETTQYFVTYKVRNNELFIGHMYVDPNYRQSGFAREMTRKLVSKAKEYGCQAVVGTVDLRAGDPNNTLMAALNIGFKIYQANNDVIVIAIKLQGES